MLATFSALLWVLFGYLCPLYDQVLNLWRVLKRPSINAVKSKFIHIRCAHIICQLLEDTRLFFGQCLGPNGFTNKGPRRFLTADLGGLIEDVRRNKILGSVTIPSQWNNQDTGNNWTNHQGKGHRGNMQANFILGCRPNAKGSGPLLATNWKWDYIPKTTGEGVAGAKPRKLLSSVH